MMSHPRDLDEVTLNLNDETISPSGEALNLSGGTSVKPSDKNFN